ncbi:MAG: succinate dehydrogenase assembly factor 2 [Gammaproteobacteria bacterium]|jgi:antitoxin CptB|nr:succinate dehydrogenase assembly factor 2 [Gammaproteobacteria bacterium]
MDPLKFAKLRWACRRGMLELDIIFGAYVDHDYIKATDEEQRSFEALLSCNDQELYNWLIKREAAPSQFTHIVAELLKRAELEG